MSSMPFLASEDPSHDSSPDAPVMVLLHGYGSNERDLPGLTPLLPALRWVSVRAPLEMPGAGAAWFPLSLPEEPDPHAIDAATHALWSWIDEHLPPAAPLVPVGFSQGGLRAAQLLRSRPERIAATVVLAGFVGTAVQPADAALARTRPPVFWGRGDADPVIWPAAVARTAQVLPGISTLTARTYPGLGHGVDAAMLADVRSFLEEALGG